MKKFKFRYVFKGIKDDYYLHNFFSLNFIEKGKAKKIIKAHHNSGYELISRDLYTGSKDKSGRDIYEGDIINQKYKLGNRYYLIKYDNKLASFVMKKLNRNNYEPNEIGTETRFYSHDWKKLEVVGSKYQNSELLKGD